MIGCRTRRVIDFFRYDIKRGIKNLFIWFPVIWKDRNWDHHYIYCILKHKLNLMEKNIRNGHHLHCEKDADKIKKCVLLLDRIIKDDYHDISMRNHYKKWGEPNFRTEKCKDGDLYEFHIDYENVNTEEDKEKQRKEFMDLHKHEVYLKNQDLDMLFNIMRKNIEGWWD